MVGQRHFAVEIYTPDGPAYAGEATLVRLPASDGLMGILGGRAPLVTRLGAGEMTCSEPTGDERGFYLAGGFAQMRGDKLVVLPDQCVPVEELSPEDAWDELSEARKLPRETAEQERLREDAIATARIKFRVAQKHHGRRRPDTADTTDEWD